MGFFARNITTGPSVDVDINDLGLTMRVGEDYDLSTVSPNEVQNSTNLQDAINGGDVIILDPTDDSTPLSVSDSIGVVTAANIPHYGIIGGSTLDQLDDVDTSTTPPLVSEVLEWDGSNFVPGDSRMRWLNEWTAGTYRKNDTVFDAPWTMVANKTTTERAAPQLDEIGSTLPDDITWATNTQSTVVSGQEYEVNSDALYEVVKYRVYLPTDSTTTSFVMSLYDVTGDRIEIDTFTIPERVASGWFERSIQLFLAGPGKKLQALLVANRLDTSPLENVFQYFNDGLAPGTGEITSDLTTLSYVYVSKTDKLSAPVDLSTLTTNSEILIEESNDRFQLWKTTGAVVDATTYWNVPAELIDSNKDVRDNKEVDTTIAEPTGVPADYVFNSNYWPTNQLVDGIASGVIGTGLDDLVGNTNAYGSDIFGAAYTLSPDWDLVALSSSAGSGATSIGEAPIDGTPYARQDADWLPTNVDFRETVQTGLTSGGELTQVTSTTIDIEAGSGFIIDAYTDPLNPVKTEISWSASSGVTVTQAADVGFTSIVIDNTGSVVQADGDLNNSQERLAVKLGRAYFEGGSIQSVFSAPRVINQTSNNFYDYLSFLGGNASNGFSVQKVTDQLSIFRGAGSIFIVGVDWNTTPEDPNDTDIAAAGDESTPAEFSTVIRDGTVIATGVTVIPKTYDDGTATPASVTGNDAVIHYLLENAGGARYLQLGQTVYSDFKKASDALFNDATNFVFFPNADPAGFALLAQLLVGGDADDFEDATKAGINNILGEGGIANSSGSQSDELVKVTSDDEFPDYLANKAVAGTGIDINVLNPGSNEQLEISIDQTSVNFYEPTQTGVISGGEVSIASATTIDITSGTGFVMDSYTDPLVPAKTDVSWSATAGLTVNQLNPVGFTSVSIDGTGAVVQVDGALDNPQERTLIELARVYYDSGSVIDIVSAPRVVNQTATTYYDLINFLSDSSTLSKGLSIQKVDNPPALSIFRGSGKFFLPGVNWPGTKTDPNVLDIAADGDDATPAAFDVVFRDGTVDISGATVIPQATDDGTLTPDNLGLGQATIHYMFENAGGVRYLQYGQVVYGSYTQASQRLFNDATSFEFFPDANTGGFLLLAQIVVQGNANDFENTARAGINNILGEGGISSGGSETDEKVKITSSDTVSNYLDDKVVAGEGIQLNVLNPAANETLEVALGSPLQIAQLTGADSATSEPMLFLTDSTRSNKVLSVESTAWQYGNTSSLTTEDIFPVNIDHGAVGYIAPYDGTVVRASGYTESNNVATTNIELRLNESGAAIILTFSGTEEQPAFNTDIDVNFSAGDRLRVSLESGSVADVAITLWVKWRKV